MARCVCMIGCMVGCMARCLCMIGCMAKCMSFYLFVVLVMF